MSFRFLDAGKEAHAQCCAVVVPNMVYGGALVADNAVNHGAALRPMLSRALRLMVVSVL